MHPRYPGRRHWSAVKQSQVKLPQMTPEEFLTYWDVTVTYGQMAMICLCSERTVKRWFAVSGNSPTIFHKFLLAVTHDVWSGL